MTEKLFYQDAYLKEFQAEIKEVVREENGVRIRLDKTAFYPEGGGQPADNGMLLFSDGTRLQVTDVQESEGEVWHYAACGPENNSFLIGQTVKGTIDWERRFDHMQQHSGEHIVSGMLCKRFQCDNIGFHMGKDMVVIDYSAAITYEQALEIEAQANAYIWEDHPFVQMWPSDEELKNMTFRSKKEIEGAARITSFPGADTCACCGTHVSSAGQVGLVKFLSAKKSHEGTRLELLCGKRAMDFLSMNYAVNKEASMMMSTSEENTADRVRHLLDENIRLKTSLSELEDDYLKLRAEAFTEGSDPLVIDDRLSSVQGRALADLIADRTSGRVAVFTKTGTGYQYAVIQRNADISGFIKELNAALNGRGGGRNGFAQGSVQAGKKEIEAFFEMKQ